jgi:GDP-D-mannose 3', 5'-epimerase
MGGAGFILTGANDVDVMCDSARINGNVVRACRGAGVPRLLSRHRRASNPTMCSESRSSLIAPRIGLIRLRPTEGTGGGSCFAERLHAAWARAGEARVKIARPHNVPGPGAMWCGRREKAPAALCSTVASCRALERDDVAVVEGPPDGTLAAAVRHAADVPMLGTAPRALPASGR